MGPDAAMVRPFADVLREIRRRIPPLERQAERCRAAEAKLTEIATLCRNPAAFVGQTMAAGRVVPGDRMAARILAIIGGEEGS